MRISLLERIHGVVYLVVTIVILSVVVTSNFTNLHSMIQKPDVTVSTSAATEEIEVEEIEELATVSSKVVNGLNLFRSLLNGDLFDYIFRRAAIVESTSDSDNDGQTDWMNLDLGTEGELWIYDEGETVKYVCENLQIQGKIYSGWLSVPDNGVLTGNWVLDLSITTPEGTEEWFMNVTVAIGHNEVSAWGSLSLTDSDGNFQFSISQTTPLKVTPNHPAIFTGGEGIITFVVNGEIREIICKSTVPGQWRLWYDENDNGIVDIGEETDIVYDYLTGCWATENYEIGL